MKIIFIIVCSFPLFLLSMENRVPRPHSIPPMESFPISKNPRVPTGDSAGCFNHCRGCCKYCDCCVGYCLCCSMLCGACQEDCCTTHCTNLRCICDGWMGCIGSIARCMALCSEK